jgi:hypothetical protein
VTASKFNVGDRVKVVGGLSEGGNSFVGETGIVDQVDCMPYNTHVKMDEDIAGYASAHWFKDCDLEAVPTFKIGDPVEQHDTIGVTFDDSSSMQRFKVGDWVTVVRKVTNDKDAATWASKAMDPLVGGTYQVMDTSRTCGYQLATSAACAKGVVGNYWFSELCLKKAMKPASVVLGPDWVVTDDGYGTLDHKTPEATKDTVMTPIKLTQKTFITGAGYSNQDVSVLTNDSIFEAISASENEIKRLGAIENKPKALEKRIADIQAGIDQLVAIVDARSAETGA